MAASYIDFRHDKRKLESYEAIHRKSGLIKLLGYSGLILRGNDYINWLQGQVTNDLRHLKPGEMIEFCLCNPTGQILAVCKGWQLNDYFVILTNESAMPALIDRCERFVIMEDVSYEAMNGIWISIQGPNTDEALNKIFDESCDENQLLALKSNRCGFDGWDIWFPQGAEAKLAFFENLIPVVDEDVFKLMMLEAGEPIFGADIELKTLPPELGKSFESRTISYEKGCYIGQEILHRIFSRGHTNRTWVQFKSKRPMSPGSILDAKGKAGVGYITRSGWSPKFGELAAGYVKNEFISEGNKFEVVGPEESIEAEVYELPLIRRS